MCETTDYPSNGKEKLISDMKAVMSDAEEILRATTDVAGDRVGEVRERIAECLCDAKARIAGAEDLVIGRTKVAARVANDYVNQNPWCAVGIAAGVGLLLGIIIGRR